MFDSLQKITLSTAKQGFTLMELLIVITLSVFIVTLVTPRAISLYDNLSARLTKLQWQGLAERTSYEAFIRQASCVLANVGEDNGGSAITISCDGNIIYQKQTDDVSLKTGSSLIFNTKGFRMAVKENDDDKKSETEERSESKL